MARLLDGAARESAVKIQEFGMFGGFAPTRLAASASEACVAHVGIVYTFAFDYMVLDAAMNFTGFDWDAGNRVKCQKHGMSLLEIESVFAGRVLMIGDSANSALEERQRAIGRTASGRMAFVVFTMRGEGIRPISARYMHRGEVEAYEKDNS
jgi:uncharacterized protein